VRLLIYHGKYGDEYWLAYTPERLEAAMQKLFTRLDEWRCYEDDEQNIVFRARAGDARAIRWLLDRHNGYEYEGWDLEKALDPCTP
jgi:hypothetical protein